MDKERTVPFVAYKALCQEIVAAEKKARIEALIHADTLLEGLTLIERSPLRLEGLQAARGIIKHLISRQ